MRQWPITLGGYFAVTIHMCLKGHNCYHFISDTVGHELGNSLKMQWLQVGILAGRTLRQRHCTLEYYVRYCNLCNRKQRRLSFFSGGATDLEKITTTNKIFPLPLLCHTLLPIMQMHNSSLSNNHNRCNF